MAKWHIQYLNNTFKKVELGILREYLHKDRLEPAVKEIDDEIDNLNENINALLALKIRIKEEIENNEKTNSL